MKKKVFMGIGVVMLLSAGFTGGWLSSRVTSNQQAKEQVNMATREKNTVSSEKYVDIPSGTGMDPSELYSELQKRSGQDFDSQYMAYAILMRNTMTGMDRLAKEKAENPDLRAKASEMWGYDSRTTTELYALQKSLGYTD